MKALLSASSSLSRRLLSSKSSGGRKYVATAAAHSVSVSRQTMQLCAAYEHTSHKLDFFDVPSKTMMAIRPSRRLMGTSAQKEEYDSNDIDVAVQAANER